MKLSRTDFEDERANLSIKNQDDYSKIAKICNALSSEVRLKMIEQLQHEPLTVPELAKKNFLSVSATVYNVNCLYESGIIDIVYHQAKGGSVRTCYRMLKDVYINLFLPYDLQDETEVSYSMGVGQFVNCEGSTDCSFVTTEKLYHVSWNNVFIRERFDAQLFFSLNGTVTYAFPSNFATMHNCTELNISLEICSETFEYDNSWKSDITFWINGVELFTYTSPADFGGRRGLLNPNWWKLNASQHGELKVIKITGKGTFLDGELVNKNVTIDCLDLKSSPAVLFKLGNKPDAEYVGGFNIFGSKFGDYPQDIVLTAKYKG